MTKHSGGGGLLTIYERINALAYSKPTKSGDHNVALNLYLDLDLTKSFGNNLKIVNFGKPIALAYLKQTINYSHKGWIETDPKP